MEFKEIPFLESEPLKPFQDPIPAGGIQRTFSSKSFGEITFICAPNQEVEVRTINNPFTIKAEIISDSEAELVKIKKDVILETVIGDVILESKGEVDDIEGTHNKKIVFANWTSKSGARKTNPLILNREQLANFEVRLVDTNKRKEEAA